MLHASQMHEDVEDIVEGEEAKASQRSRCNDVILVVFGFILHENQIKAIRTLFYEREDLLLIATSGFSKSLIFSYFHSSHSRRSDSGATEAIISGTKRHD